MIIVGRTAYNSSRSILANYKYAYKVVAGSSITNCQMGGVRFSSISTPMTAKMVVYSDSAGAPNTLLATSDEVTVAGEGGQVGWFPFSTPFNIVSGTTYWLGIIVGTSVAIQIQTGSGSSLRNSDTYSDGAASPFGTGTSATEEGAIFLIQYAEAHISKGSVLSVVAPVEAGLGVSKVLVHAVTAPVEAGVGISKVVVYSVFQNEGTDPLEQPVINIIT